MSRRSGKRVPLARLTTEQLLALRLCDLPCTLAGSPIARALAQLRRELRAKGLRFSPAVWISDEWFSPDSVPGIAVPFYLTHPRLVRLERRMMFEAEGAAFAECLRILRHEAGHAIDTAYRLHRRRSWQRLFGSFTRRYPRRYRPRPRSRHYVLHLNDWYAQAHPAEDWAETFAVWLTPRSGWRTRYAEWPALKKLEYVDQVMEELRERAPSNRRSRPVDPLHHLTRTLAEHYTAKQRHYTDRKPRVYDSHLMRVFSVTHPRRKGRGSKSAAEFLSTYRARLADAVAKRTKSPRYTARQVLEDVRERAVKRRLWLCRSERETFKRLVVVLSRRTMELVRKGHYQIAL